MQTARTIDRYILARQANVLRVDFNRDPDPPAPRFPGAGALRQNEAPDIGDGPFLCAGHKPVHQATACA
jgi:hypothetical protein